MQREGRCNIRIRSGGNNGHGSPVRYRAVLLPLLLLVVLRIFIRLSYDSATLQCFGLSRARNFFHLYLVSQCAAIIALQLLWW